MNTKLNFVADGLGWTVWIPTSGGQTIDCINAQPLLDALPEADRLVAECDCEVNGCRKEIKDKGIYPCIPSRRCRINSIPPVPSLYKSYHCNENNFALMKTLGWVEARLDPYLNFRLSVCAPALSFAGPDSGPLV